jgi:aminopeptidase N
MKRILFLLIIINQSILALADDGYKRNPLIDIVNYTFNISLSDSSDVIFGEAAIKFLSRRCPSILEFDLKNISSDGKGMAVDYVKFNGRNINWSHTMNKVTLNPDTVNEHGNEFIIELAYHGIPSDGLIIAKNKFGNRSFFSDHWPDRARNYLPCIDHPYDKATIDFLITVPSHYEVVANGYLVEERYISSETKMTHWREEAPLALKVTGFAAAEFDYTLSGIYNNIPVWTYVFRENREAGYNDFAVAIKPLILFSELIGDYPYKKLANVQSKTIFGGLENADCIFYAENSVTGRGRAEGLIAHEVSHQWFGNSVTENDWYHIWLSEGFATYMTNVYMEKTYGKEQLATEMKTDREQVLRYYFKSPRPVIDTTITNLMRLLNVNSYQKGSWILHMLRHNLGDEIFWEGIRTYYSTYRDKNVDTDDFITVMEKVSGKDLGLFFNQWLYEPGQPELIITSTFLEGRGMNEIIIEQKQENLFIFPLELLIDSEGAGIIRKSIDIDKRITKVELKTGKIKTITPDPDTNLLFSQVSD